jgi:DNA-binding FadR family transcriptional regulator
MRVRVAFDNPSTRLEVWAEHRAIADAIAAGDPERTEVLMTAHMDGYQDRFRTELPGMMTEAISWE